MKKLFIFLLALPLVLTACSSDDDDNAGATSVVTFDQKQFTVANEGGDILVNLHNAKAVPELNYLGDASDWIELAQSAGGSYANDRKYYFHVAANESYESDRTGRIVFTCGEQRDTITVSQSGGRPIIFMGSDTLRVSGMGGKVEAVVNSNFDFSCIMPTEQWVGSAEPDAATTRGVVKEQKVYFEIAPNTTLADRTAQVVYYDPQSSVRDTLVILQSAPIVMDSPHAFTLSPEAHTLNLTLNPSLPIRVVQGFSWLKADDKGTINVEALPEDSVSRLGIVMYVNSTNTIAELIMVHQRRPVLIMGGDSVMVHRIGLVAQKNYQLLARMTDRSDNTFTWASSDPAVATVASDGTVTPLANGQTTVTATTPQGESAACLVEVKDPKEFMDFFLTGSYTLKDDTQENTVVCSMVNHSVYPIRVTRCVINEGKTGAVTRTINQNVAVGDTVTTNATLKDMHPSFKWYFTINGGTAYSVTATEENSAISKQARRKD